MARILPGETDLYGLTDSRLSRGRSVQEIVISLLKSGVRIIQYREKKLSCKKMLEECKILRELTRDADACFIVNDHVDIALMVQADGIHLGQDDLPIGDVRALVGPNMIIGLSTHSPRQALAAVASGADYIGVGPIFATKTKEDVIDPVGFEYLDWVVQNVDIPFVAIGGIKAHNIGELAAHGVKCCALVSEFTGAENIEEKVREVRGNFQVGSQNLV